jgi:hypothetical protein
VAANAKEIKAHIEPCSCSHSVLLLPVSVSVPFSALASASLVESVLELSPLLLVRRL